MDDWQVPIEPMSPEEAELYEDTPAYLTPTVQRAIARGADLIDFPVSALWASHYASLGLTKDFPPEFYQEAEPVDEFDIEQITRLAGSVDGLEADVDDLNRKLRWLIHAAKRRARELVAALHPKSTTPAPSGKGGFQKL